MKRRWTVLLAMITSLALQARAEIIILPTYLSAVSIRSSVDIGEADARRAKKEAKREAQAKRSVERQFLVREAGAVDINRGQAGEGEPPLAHQKAERDARKIDWPGARAGAVCSDDETCYGWCVEGRCTNTRPAPLQSELPDNCGADQECGEGRLCRAFRCVEVEVTLGASCTDDDACGDGRACTEGRCASRAPVVPLPQRKCSTTEQCGPGQACTEGQCVTPPPSPPSSLWPSGTELFLRGRTTELRQELALGEGPVISTLARVLRVDARHLGRSMRAHRRELAALVGEANDVQWPARFLREAQLCSESDDFS